MGTQVNVLSFYVTGRVITIQSSNTIYISSGNNFFAHFSFYTDWSTARNKTAIFYKNSNIVKTVQIIDNQCMVPPELLTTPGKLYISVSSTLNGEAIKTNTITVECVILGTQTTQQVNTPIVAQTVVSPGVSYFPYSNDTNKLEGQVGAYYLDWTNTTNKPDPTITLAGDLTGNVTLTNVGSGTLTATVVDDSHNHVISNIDDLQTALNGKVDDGQVLTDVPLGAVFTDTVYTHPSSHPASIITQDENNRFMSDTERNKLSGIAAGAEVNVQSDWNATEGDAFINNKPTSLSQFSEDTTHRVVTDSEKNIWADKYTKQEVNNIVSSVYKFKGNVNTYTSLPTLELVIGDVYNVLDTGINFAWTGTDWDDIGGVEATATASNNGLMSKEDFSKLSGIASGAEVNVNADWNASSGDAQILNKPTTMAPAAHTQAASTITDFDTEVGNHSDVSANTSARHSHSNKSTLDSTTASYTTEEQSKLSGIASGAEVNVSADWDATVGDAVILNKPTIPVITGKEDSSNKVTSLSSSSTDVQYPSAKVTYDSLALKAPLIAPDFTGVVDITGTTATDSPTFGAELLTGGTWTSTDWTGDNTVGWTHTTGNVSPLNYSATVTIGNLYQIQVTKTGSTAGTCTMTIGGATTGTISGANATYYHAPKATATTGLRIVPESTFNGTIVVSVKQIAGISTSLLNLKSSNGTVQTEIRANTGLNNTFIGTGSGRYNTNGNLNSAFGVESLYSNTTGLNNVSIGYRTLNNNTTGSYNTSIGDNSLKTNTVGYQNVANGSASLYNNTTGYQNVAIGASSLYAITTGLSNVGVGYQSLYTNINGYSNVAIGTNSLLLSTNISNTATGANSGRTLTTGNTNTFNGFQAGFHASQKVDAVNSTAIGANTYTTANNQVVIGDSSTTEFQFGQGLAVLTPTELGYLDGVTSAIQTQINAKVSTGSAATLASVTLTPVTIIYNATTMSLDFNFA